MPPPPVSFFNGAVDMKGSLILLIPFSSFLKYTSFIIALSLGKIFIKLSKTFWGGRKKKILIRPSLMLN